MSTRRSLRAGFISVGKTPTQPAHRAYQAAGFSAVDFEGVSLLAGVLSLLAEELSLLLSDAVDDAAEPVALDPEESLEVSDLFELPFA